jgi:hypothetical protein
MADQAFLDKLLRAVDKAAETGLYICDVCPIGQTDGDGSCRAEDTGHSCQDELCKRIEGGC